MPLRVSYATALRKGVATGAFAKNKQTNKQKQNITKQNKTKHQQ